MSFLFKKVKNISQRTKNSVNGFIHECQLLLSKSRLHSIPLVVNMLCILYYHPIDEWNIKQKLKNAIINENIVSTTDSHVVQTIYLSKSIKLGQAYTWRFRIIKHSFLLDIGIKGNDGSKYIFDAAGGTLVNATNGKSFKNYGIACRANHIIDMVLYLRYSMPTLCFTINDVNYGVAFKVNKEEYKAFVHIQAEPNQSASIELLDTNEI
eukprot:535612_1